MANRDPTRPTPPGLAPLADLAALGTANPDEIRAVLMRLDALHRDVLCITAGTGPRASDLARAPLIERWSLGRRTATCLVGQVRGHPTLPLGPVTTSELWALSEQHGWARTLSRWYRLGARDLDVS